MALFTMSSIPLLLLIGVAYVVIRAVYRVTLHPLAQFPGPRLASFTSWYAISYDLSGKDSLVKHLKGLHDIYGPIVRVRPDELHIFDWDAYRTVFAAKSNFSKPSEFYNAPQVEGCLLNVTTSAGAKPRRDLFVQAFSKASINKLEPLIHEKIELFFARLANAAREDKIVDLDLAFNCLTGDVTMHYCYQGALGMLNAPDFHHPLVMQLHEFAPIVPFFWYFPRLGGVMNNVIFKCLPRSIVEKAFPAASYMLNMMDQCRDLIHALSLASPDSPEVQQSIFSKALNPDKEKGQYVATDKELAADAVLMYLAGTDTTAHALVFAAWAMMKDPSILEKLRAELDESLASSDSHSVSKDKIIPVSNLEHLPYLRGIVKEAIRVSLGTSSRLPRVVPPNGAILADRLIPAGTRVSFTHYVYNNDPMIFADPHAFIPERWVVSPNNPQSNIDKLEAHMVSFSRGSRNCIGMNLAYAELFTTLANMGRRFDLVNDELTTDEDMDWIDTFTPRFHGNLRCRIKLR